MRHSLFTILFIVHYSSFTVVNAQELSGYLTGMPSMITMSPGSEVWWNALAHNRLNFGWKFADNWRVDAGMRNRIMAGSEALIDADGTGYDKGWLDMSWNIFEHKNALLNTSFDRLFVTFEKDQWNIKIGRQRINWGQTLVWNPNDIFNTHSFFDFDYAERSGCDALRATFFHNETASTELAASVNHFGQATAALLHHWSRHGFDYQLIAGELAQSEAVLGGAWSGDFSGLNFRGEFSYFHPLEHHEGWALQRSFAISTGVDYLFSNSLMLQAEALFNTINGGLSNGFMSLYAAPLSAKVLSFAEMNIFAQASYPLTPRLSGAVSAMYFVDKEALYGGFSLDFSVIENMDFSLIAQAFSIPQEPNSINLLMGFARVKWSF